ncbi:MAG: UDP-N-acetylglucosamine 1-carboxyvinyltransferase, partial [Actinobacteria bacterium]|nr:UDP-N-acetylglucosamine 1-carboxyvinyltransferase [Actinomycetota bacterium]
MFECTHEPRFIVRGGARLAGRVAVSGAKNSALKLMSASLLAPGTSVLHNVPDIQDVRTMREVLEHLGARVTFADGTLSRDTT